MAQPQVVPSFSVHIVPFGYGSSLIVPFNVGVRATTPILPEAQM
ncbi:MAG TPA: hypothetical protein VF707_16595 [Ardenticatenaceae bacterium]